MAVNMLTQEDLEQFKVQFFEGQKEFLNQIMDIATRLNEVQELSEFDGKPWLKSKDLEKLMGITSGTLQTLRNNGTVPYSKVGGVMLYSQDDIRKMIEQNKRNIQ
jgi:Mn-dependent DtxR family transcriptional regulator